MRKTLISQMQHICNQQGKNEYLTQNGKFWPKKKGSRYFFWIVGLESWGGRVCVLYILVRTILYLLKRRNLHLQQTITYGYSSNVCVFCVRLGSQTVGSFVISQFHKNKLLLPVLLALSIAVLFQPSNQRQSTKVSKGDRVQPG